jgi:hypothetical protein
MITVRVPNFTPSRHGFPFVNAFPWGTPALQVATPFGRIAIGNAGAGLCGGMVFAAMDFHVYSAPIPASPEPPVFRYLVRRQIASWNLPFGVPKYYDWQRRAGATKRFAVGLTRLTITREWPRIRAELDAGRLAPLGLVQVSGYRLRDLPRNHQVLGYGYDVDEEKREVTVRIYDPNHPGADDAALMFGLRDTDAEQLIVHSREGATVRGFFLTRYRKPSALPTF